MNISDNTSPDGENPPPLQHTEDSAILRDDTVLRRVEQQAAVQAQQLEAIFEAMSDGLFVYDRDGHILRMNKVARDLLGLDARPDYLALSLEDRGTMLMQRYVPGQSLPSAQWATSRVLSGEVLTDATAVEFTTRGLHGREIRINLSGAPIRDQEGNIVGAINIVRDITERWRLEQRTQDTFHALLAMAETLVEAPQEARIDGMEPPAATLLVGQRLVDLVRNVLGCRRVSLTTLAPGTDALRPVAAVGFSPEEEQRWMREIRHYRLGNYLTPELFNRLRASEVVLNDLTQARASDLSTYGAREVLVAPMLIDSHLIGILVLDYGSAAHSFTSEEIALFSAAAKLAALVIERERLLREQAEVRARELALHETTQRLDEFLGIIAHELRTPLAGLIAFVQTLLVQTAQRKGPPLAAWQQQALEGLDLAAARLSELTDDLLDMAQLQAGQLELHPHPIDLVRLAQRAVMRQQVMTERHTINLASAVKRLVLSIDPRRIEQVLTNLISNAIKYSPEGGSIAVTIGKNKRQEALLSVRDEGIGIPEQQQPHIFRRFVQADNARAYAIEGAGLGLYLCRAIVEQHGGRIWFESVEGQGSTFFVALPIAAHAAGG